MRSFLSGLIWGGVVSTLGLGIVSQLSEPPGAANLPGPVVADLSPTPDAATEAADQTAEAADDRAPEPEAATIAESGAEPFPVAAAPEQDGADPDTRAADPADTTAAPTAGEPAGGVVDAADPLLDNAVPPTVDVAAPDAPAAPPGPASLPDTPELTETGTAAFDPTRIILPEEGDAAPGLAELPPPPPLTPEEEAMLAELARAADEAEKAAVAAGLVPVPDDVPEAGVELDVAALPPGAVPEPVPEGQPAEPAAAVPEAGAPVSVEDAEKPQPGFSGAVDGVTTGRLPSIGAPGVPPAEAPKAAEGDPADTQALPPLQRHAAAFDGAGGKPLFSIVLVDPGGPDVDRLALADLPLPVSIAIDPSAPDAATAAEIYRTAGKEVVMLATGIPAGATAADLETTFQAHEAALPESVAVMDLDQDGFQNDRPLAAQVVPVIAGQGRGLLTWDKGLNAGDQEARRAGLAAAKVFRQLDAGDESAPVIRRYLDRAAFKAAQDGAVVVAGEVRPETLQALVEWAVEGRSATVALAPLSAVLLRGQ